MMEKRLGSGLPQRTEGSAAPILPFFFSNSSNRKKMHIPERLNENDVAYNI